jgi:hypothetical protein
VLLTFTLSSKLLSYYKCFYIDVQVEMQFPDGIKEIVFPDSTRKVIHPDGVQVQYARCVFGRLAAHCFDRPRFHSLYRKAISRTACYCVSIPTADAKCFQKTKNRSLTS